MCQFLSLYTNLQSLTEVPSILNLCRASWDSMVEFVCAI